MAEDTITYSEKDLNEKTVSELKLIAEDLDMSPTDVKEMTGSTSSHPTKTDYIRAILLKTSGEASSPPASTEEAPPAADPEAEWPITSPKSAAAVYRAGLRNGISREGIEAAVKEFFPTYEAQKIAYSNYRRDLIKKGLLEVKDKKKDTNE